MDECCLVTSQIDSCMGDGVGSAAPARGSAPHHHFGRVRGTARSVRVGGADDAGGNGVDPYSGGSEFRGPRFRQGLHGALVELYRALGMPRRAIHEPRLMIAPLPAATITGAMAPVKKYGALTLTP